MQFQRVKLIHGIDGVNDGDVSTINGLPVSLVNSPGVISTVNSSTAVLAGGAVFTGTSEDVSRYASIKVTVHSSHASATDGLSIQQSQDGTNWDFVDTYTIAAATGKAFGFNPAARYFRVVYTNGATLQTTFRLQTVFHTLIVRSSSQRPQDGYTNETDLEQVQAFGMVWNGTTWDRAPGTTQGLAIVNRRDLLRIADSSASAELTIATTAYTAGDQVGVMFQFAAAARVSGGTGMLVGMQLTSAADIIGAYDVVLCRSNITLAVDNAVFAISDADALNVIGLVQLAGAFDIGNNRIVQAFNLAVPYDCSGGTVLYGALITRAGHTFFGAHTDLQLTAWVERN